MRTLAGQNPRSCATRLGSGSSSGSPRELVVRVTRRAGRRVRALARGTWGEKGARYGGFGGRSRSMQRRVSFRTRGGSMP
jgi:hypothetical protein